MTEDQKKVHDELRKCGDPKMPFAGYFVLVCLLSGLAFNTIAEVYTGITGARHIGIEAILFFVAGFMCVGVVVLWFKYHEKK